MCHQQKQIVGVMIVCVVFGLRGSAADKAIPKLENPISVDYLRTHLKPTQPRLVLTSTVEAHLRSKLKTDPVLQNMYRAVQLNKDMIFREALLTRNQIGRRLLRTSRDMLWRMTVLGFVYRMEKDAKVLARMDEELRAVCTFSDWNPSHFLDTAEMSLAVAIGLDWTAGELPADTIRLAQTALVEKGLRPEGKIRIVSFDNNWNQVCNGGMIAAALTIAPLDFELGATVIRRALDALPKALVHYRPDGAYPEGSTYWQYATVYTAVTASILQSALGSDMGIWEYPGLADSAMYRVLMNASSGWYYNYGDCGSKRSGNGDLTLAWFAAQTGDRVYFEEERFLRAPESMGRLDRHVGIAMVWLSQYEARADRDIPTAWAGDGINPVVVFRGGADDSQQYYLGAKGGNASISHGNMDGGSFILELGGVRWSLELGKQSYHAIEKTGFELWGRGQQSDRWQLLSKNNFGHSTLTVNRLPHRVDGMAGLLHFKHVPYPEAAFDLTPALGDQVEQAIRTFVKDSATSLTIKDHVVASAKTELITWQMITVADVEPVTGGARLRQEGQALSLHIPSHPQLKVHVVSLDPPPHELDIRVKGLKRIEINIPVTAMQDGVLDLEVRLALSQSS